MPESVALPLLKEVAMPVVKIVMGRVTEEMPYIIGFKKELADLQKKMRIIEGIVNGMTTMAAIPNAAVEEWLRDTVRVMRSAEDMMDVLAYENHRSAVMETTRSKPAANDQERCYCYCVYWNLVIQFIERMYLQTKMGIWIHQIDKDIEKVRNEASFINDLRSLEQSATTLLLQRPAGTNTAVNDDDQTLQQVRRHPDTSLFVGRDSDVASVVNMLTKPCQNSSDDRLSVIAIVGFGGMGKTTLAKKIYNNNAIISHFGERIWISDLENIKIEKILNKMVKFLEISNHEDISEIAIRRLERHLCGKSYLLVLDDVWDSRQDLWDSMRDALESIGGSKDSMVLTTTRSNEVAVAMRANSVHHLLGLSKDDSRSLFKQIAFANKSKGEAFALEAIGYTIVEKCNGVPLAIKSIAGLMQKKRNVHEWTIIEQSELWDIPQQETGILPSLKISYNHLSPMLKKCFSLCALSLKGRWFEKYEYICRWMALGLIQNSDDGNITMEDIGERYLDELLSISFLHVHEINELGEAIGYSLHDLVYELARSIAMHERLYLEDAKKENKALDDIQHMTVVKHAESVLDFSEKLELKNIRSLHMYNLPRRLLVKVKYLRVLYIGHSTIEVVPESIATLKCLKFLDLEDNPIKVLPNCIMKLYNLQSLFLYKCEAQFKIPRGLSNLVNLRHLGLSFHFCPTEEGVIEQLSQLQTVPPLQLSEGGFQISELGSLHHVKGILDIKGLQLIKSKLDAEKTKLSMKPRIEELRLSWDNDDNFIVHEEVLDGLLPCPNLKVISIKGYGGDKFPSWIMKMNISQDHTNRYVGSLCNMIKVELMDCSRCQQLPALGHLPSLKMIKITNMEKLKHIGPEFYGFGDFLPGNSDQASSNSSSCHEKSMANFGSLKELRLSGLDNLEEWWEPSQGECIGFPSLEVLVIEKCRRLRKAPHKFLVLRDLVIKDMSSDNLLRNIMSNKSSLNCLKKLDIHSVKELTYIPKEVGECTSLQKLFVMDCPSLIGLPDSLSKLLSLELLQICGCPNLISIPNLSCLGCLRELCIFKNDGLRMVPEGLQSCKSLDVLAIVGCPKVETLPNLAGLRYLRILSIMGMAKLISNQSSNWLYNLPCLKTLYIGDYEELNEFPDMSCLFKITSLESLYVHGWRALQSLPEQLQYFMTLKTLGIFDFDNLEQLPDWLGSLSSLQYLFLTRCRMLKKLPSKEAVDRLTNLKYSKIEDCPLLGQAIKETGQEISKIVGRRIQVKIINSIP